MPPLQRSQTSASWFARWLLSPSRGQPFLLLTRDSFCGLFVDALDIAAEFAEATGGTALAAVDLVVRNSDTVLPLVRRAEDCFGVVATVLSDDEALLGAAYPYL